MNFYKMIIFLFTLLTFTGCYSQNSLNVHEVKRDGINAVIMDNSSKVTHFKEHGNLERFCASRSADVEQTSSSGFIAGFSTPVQGENIGEQASNGALSLGGRSPSVLITRELIYRACELSLNLNADQETTIKIYKMFLNSINTAIKNEHDTGSSSLADEPNNILLTQPIRDKDNNNQSNNGDEDKDEDEENTDDD